jgi:DNA mismatch repair protein MutS
MLPEKRDNYLAAVVSADGCAGLAYIDITTGQFRAVQFTGADAGEQVRHELARLAPAELLLPEDAGDLHAEDGIHQTRLAACKFEPAASRQALCDQLQVSTLAGYGIEARPLAIGAAGAIVHYLRETQATALQLLSGLCSYDTTEFMQLDAATRRNLELTETMRPGGVEATLLGVLDCTVTPMGSRLLRRWLQQPLLDVAAINERLDGVSAAHGESLLRAGLRKRLRPLGDLERLTNRVSGSTANPRDLDAIRATLRGLPALKESLTPEPLAAIAQEIDPTPEALELLRAALTDEPPAKTEKPGFIRPGWSAELDAVMSSSHDAREWISTLEAVERKRTGIKSLKVGFNKVFGYYIEITQASRAQAPDDYIRKQTLVNAERYITPELKEYETLVINAEEQMLTIERRVFTELCAQIGAYSHRLLRSARALARLDVLTALAETAARLDYVRPIISSDAVLELRDARHPVVEQHLPAGERFVPNDCHFETGDSVWVITGPNMSGKSTFLRQIAQCVLLAQIGSFVPAAQAHVGVVDRIFTRIGAQDEIHAGQSTFMVEMVETANILHHATARSLLILDEIGRGTSTYDGLSLAWAIVEYVHNHPDLRAKTLFASHYHELLELAEMLPGVRNYNVAVAEEGETVVFTHRIVPGGADRSYGLHVAKLAGLPGAVVQRAEELLATLESVDGRAKKPEPDSRKQLALFPRASSLLDELRQLDVNALSPLQALQRLYDWQQRFSESAPGVSQESSE